MAMTLRLSEAEDRALTETALREHKTKQEVARAAILEYTSLRTRKRDELLAEIAAENVEAFKRLGDS